MQVGLTQDGHVVALAPTPVTPGLRWQEDMRALLLTLRGALGHPDNIATADQALALLDALGVRGDTNG